MKKIKLVLLSSIIAASLLMTGCDSNPQIYSTKVSQLENMSRADVNKSINADEIYALYYVQGHSKERLGDKTVGEVVKMFEEQTGTKVVKGEIKDFKQYKVRDLEIQVAATLVNEQASKEQISHIKKYIQNVLSKGTPEQRKAIYDMTLGEILNK